MYEAGPIGNGQPPYAVTLAHIARGGRLAVYTGAGLSRGEPTCIPSGAEVATRCHARLSELLGADSLMGSDPTNLTSVADAVAAMEDGHALIRRAAVGVAAFTTANPNFGHEVLALLLLEGVVSVCTTNWDDCIERAGGVERVLAVITDQDRQEIHTPALLKVHGCATRPDTVLVTSEDLANPPAWVRDEVSARVADSHVVFVGIGDVADYVRSRVEEAAGSVGTGAVYVVSPTVGENWAESQWAQVLPDLPDERRLSVTADAFLDALAAAYVRLVLREIAEALEGEAETLEAFDRVRSAFDLVTSVSALRWLRACGVPKRPGDSVLRQQSFVTALVALGMLGVDGVEVRPLGRAMCGGKEYEVLVAVGNVTVSICRREAAARLTRYRSQGMDPLTAPDFIVAGAHGEPTGTEGLKQSVLVDSDPSDLVSGPLAVEPVLVRAEDVTP